MNYRAFNIKYDTDGEHEDLPQEMIFMGFGDTDLDSDQLEEMISDEISNVTGFCHMGFELEVIDTAR